MEQRDHGIQTEELHGPYLSMRPVGIRQTSSSMSPWQ